MARPQPTESASSEAGRSWPREWPQLEIAGLTVTPSELDSVLVTVWGRWLGSRPPTPGLPVLVIKDGPLSHRFGALPKEWRTEAGAAGPFRAEFSIPSELQQALAEPLVLDLGAAEVPLPADRPRIAAPAPGSDTVVDPLVLAERRAQRAQLSERAQARRAEEAERARDAVRAELDHLNERLRAARERRAGLQAELTERARSLRATTQSEHAEKALREELVAEERARREAAEEEARALRERFGEAEARARELVQDVEALRRAQVEAEQAAAAAETARRERERKLEERERRVSAAESAVTTSPDLEALELRVAALDEQLQRESAERSLVRTQLADERERAVELERELTSTRASVDEKARELALAASLVSDLVSAGELLLERLDDERRVSERGESDLEARLEELTQRVAEAERGRDAAEQKLARRLYDLAQARSATVDRPAKRTAPVKADEQRAWTMPPPASPPPAEPWLPAALERMLATDRAGAAELLLALLPAQAHWEGAPNLNYDLRLAEVGTYRVSLARGFGAVERLEQPRGRGADFRLETDAAGLLALLLAGGARQRGIDRRVTVRGTLRRQHALRRLPPVRMAPAELARAGVWLAPELLYRALSQLVERDWTDGYDFWIAHEISGAAGLTSHLHVGPEGLTVRAVAPPEQPAARIRTSRAHFQHVLGGEQPLPEDRAVISGDADAVETLGRLVELAQRNGAPSATAPA